MSLNSVTQRYYAAVHLAVQSLVQSLVQTAVHSAVSLSSFTKVLKESDLPADRPVCRPYEQLDQTA